MPCMENDLRRGVTPQEEADSLHGLIRVLQSVLPGLEHLCALSQRSDLSPGGRGVELVDSGQNEHWGWARPDEVPGHAHHEIAVPHPGTEFLHCLSLDVGPLVGEVGSPRTPHCIEEVTVVIDDPDRLLKHARDNPCWGLFDQLQDIRPTDATTHDMECAHTQVIE